MNYKFSLKQAREYAGLTAEAMGKELGCSRSTIIGYESGKTEPSVPVVRMWAEVTGIAVDDIFLPYESTKSRAISA